MKKFLLVTVALGSVLNLQADQYSHRNRSYSDNDYNRDYRYDSQNQERSNSNEDQELAKSIRNYLRSGSLPKKYDQIDVKVVDGVVTIQGSVKTWEEKNTIGKEICEMPGVEALYNNLEVQGERSGDKSNQQNYRSEEKDRNASPQDMDKKVRDAISKGWFSKGYEGVQVNVNGGNVTLRGFVNTWDEKKDVEKKIRNIDGVKNVDNQLNVKEKNTEMKRSDQVSMNDKASSKVSADEQLARAIQDSLRRGWSSRTYEQIDVTVRNGEVTLKGTVQSWEEKNDIEKRVRSIDGVKKVNNQITVADKQSNQKERGDFPQDQYASPEDKELNKKIRNKISKGWFWDSYKDIQINTMGGAVTVEGSVDSQQDKDKITKEIQAISGVRSVTNDLDVNK